MALVLVLLAGAWPHLYAAFLGPESRDAVLWITRSAVSTSGWAHWDFLDNHFVAYRPVTAFSYTLDSMVGGFSPLPYRETDLLAHLGAAASLAVLARRLAPSLPAWGAVVVAALFVLHPASALVVPHLARRAYSLATFGSVAALAVYAGPRGPTRAVGGAALLGLAALANEAAYAAFPIATLLLWLREGWSGLRALGPAVVVGVVLIALRVAILGDAGGYAVDAAGRWLPIFGAVWTGVIAADVLRSHVTPLPAVVPWVLLVLVVGGLVGPMARRSSSEEGRASLVAWVWVAVLALLFAPQGVFFPRQLYVVAAPYTLAVGLAWATVPRLEGWARWMLGGAAGLATVLILSQSPVVWGPDPVQHASWIRHDALVHDIDAAVADLPLDAIVVPVVPYYTRPDIERFRAHDDDEARSTGRQAFTWVSALRGTRFTTPVSIEHDAADPTPAATLETTPDGPVVHIPPGPELLSQPRELKVETLDDGTRLVRPVLAEGRHPPAYLYFHDGVSGSLVPLGDRL